MRKVIIILIVVLMLGATGKACDYESHYKREAIVIKVKNENVTVKDWKTGNVWEFKGTGFETATKVKLVFFDNHTKSIQDDQIVDAKRVD